VDSNEATCWRTKKPDWFTDAGVILAMDRHNSTGNNSSTSKSGANLHSLATEETPLSFLDLESESADSSLAGSGLTNHVALKPEALKPYLDIRSMSVFAVSHFFSFTQ
jgi:hypothetical protein